MRDKQINFRADAEDSELLAAIGKKLGTSTAGTIRLALRRLAELENISLKKGKTK